MSLLSSLTCGGDFIGQCHFLVTTTNDNSCKSFTVAKPKEWLEFWKNLLQCQPRLTFCTLKAIFKQLNRWESTPEAGKTKEKKYQSLQMPSCCTLLHSMVVVKGLGCFICRLPCGSLHSSNKNANSISKLNPASFAFYLGQLFLWPTASPSTMPVLSHHLCKLPSTASRSAFFPLLGSSTQGENVQDEFSDFFFF